MKSSATTKQRESVKVLRDFDWSAKLTADCDCSPKTLKPLVQLNFHYSNSEQTDRFEFTLQEVRPPCSLEYLSKLVPSDSIVLIFLLFFSYPLRSITHSEVFQT
ncbi:hypothetical protein AB6A40_009315 [Gnathostoma spinigerum]|uniref:COMM domain-containing protein n=1 Tax=Gnathostoma spinigerum TaxID=75299 RepID=A0ABD6ETH2_9BILA